MAQTLKINALVGELTRSFAEAVGDKDSKKLKTTKETVSRIARTHQYTRTNQFEVDSTLTGLLEKFSVLNRDDLAEALEKRLDELNGRSRSKWTPEILSLFLHLSDRPDRKASLEALDLLRPPTPPPPPITWEELEAEEALQGDVWLDESYSSASEDELEIVEAAKTPKKPRFAAAVIVEDDETEASVTKTVSSQVFTDLTAAQFWTQADLSSSKPQLLTELQVIREILLMLRGLPTSIFALDQKNILVYNASNIMLSQISLSGLNDVLQAFASMGSDLFRLRSWLGRPQTASLLQALNSALSKRLQDFDRQIAEIESQFVQPLQKTVIISVLQVHRDVESLTSHLTALSNLTTGIPVSGGDFVCLELLYDQLCSVQAAGDEQSFTTLGLIFFECLNVYLRPVSLWMEQGTILENDESFFIAVADKGSPLSSLWHERYTLRMTNDGTLHAPKFLIPAAKKILNAGKSIVFLQNLRKSLPEAPKQERINLSLSEAGGLHGTLPLLPFSELFSSAFSTWMYGKYGPASTILRHHLFDDCNLIGYVGVLEHVYFSKDGVLFQTFADELFKRIGSQRAAWNDKFLLTELARRTFGSVDGLKASSLSVRTSAPTATKSSITRGGVKSLANIALDINLPWAVQNVLQRSSFHVYQAIFTLLLQIYYAKSLLRTYAFATRQTTPTSRLAIGIRQQLTWFADVMHSYILETVISAATETLKERLIIAEDVDVMCKCHEEVVRGLEMKCLLKANLTPIYESVLGMLDLAVSFAAAQDTGDTIKEVRRKKASSANRGRRRHRAQDEEEDEDSASEGDEDAGSDAEKEHEREDNSDDTIDHTLTPTDRLQSIHDRFSQSLHFTIAGLRAVSRAGGQVEWEMLAEKLEWGMQRKIRASEYI